MTKPRHDWVDMVLGLSSESRSAVMAGISRHFSPALRKGNQRVLGALVLLLEAPQNQAGATGPRSPIT